MVRPILDFMQTLPVFVYLIPAVFFFGIGVVPGVISTLVFAIPPAVRLTELGIRSVDKEVVEAAIAFGAKPRQMLREVQLPLALPSIMAGVNQTLMLALSMVVISGLVGAGGLGAVVVRGISTLDVGAGFEGGLAVVFLAIYLDRLTASLAKPRRRRPKGRKAAAAPAATSSTRPGRPGVLVNSVPCTPYARGAAERPAPDEMQIIATKGGLNEESRVMAPVAHVDAAHRCSPGS